MDMLRQHLQHIRKRNYAASTYNSYYAAIECFFEFLIFEEYIDHNPIPAFRKRYLRRVTQSAGKHTRQPLNTQQVRNILKIAQNKGICETAIILTFAKCGLRRGEFMSLTVEDLNFDKHIITIPEKAKRSYNIAFMDHELEKVLKQYLIWRKHQNPKTKYLWVS